MMHLVTRKNLIKIVAMLLHTDSDTPLPPRHSINMLAEQLSYVFSKNISKIRSERIQNVNIIDIYTDGNPQTCRLTALEPATETEIAVLLK